MKKRTKKTLYGALFIISVYALFMAIPKTLTTEWLGVTSIQDRIKALQSAGFWYTRSLLVPQKGEKAPEQQFGQLTGLTSDGRVVLKVSDGPDWKKMALPLAGVEIQDLYRAAIHISSLKGISASIDVYKEPRESASYSVVVWVHQKPVNLNLVEDGYARPEPKPVTSIMDIAYAHYYWRLAKGKSIEGTKSEMDAASQADADLKGMSQ